MTEKSIELTPSLLQVVNTVTQETRAKILEYIAHEKMTFTDLLSETDLSKSALSRDLLQLSKNGLIICIPSRKEKTYYSLTQYGERIHEYLHLCEGFLFTVPFEVKKIILDADDFIRMFEEYDVDSLKYLLKDLTVVLPLKSYEKIVEWLDEKIASEEQPDKFQEIENLLYEKKFVKVVESYDNVDKALDIELYMKKQKKLTQEQAELVAVASDQNGTIVSSKNQVMMAAMYIGRQVLNVQHLLDYLKAQKLRVIARTQFDLGLRQTDFLNVKPQRTSSNATFRTRNPSVKYQIAILVTG